MNLTVCRLLKGYLTRSVWLYVFFGLGQFLMLCAFWADRIERVPLTGAFLSMWGSVAALNRHSLVWRSLPLTRRDASMFRWWATAAIPGCILTLLILLAWGSQYSAGLPIPKPSVVLLDILASWAALGAVAALPRATQWIRSRSGMVRILVRPVAYAIPFLYGMLLVYGLPVGSAARPYSAAFVCAGISLLIVSAARARRGLDWRWPDIADRSSRTAGKRSTSLLARRYGLSAILFPLMQRTAIFAVIATAIIVSLQRVFPRASIALFWVYFIGLSTAGFLLTYQVRRAIQPLRCLPLSARQLAGLLQLFGALPGLATLALTLLINRAVLNARLDIALVATFALVIISSQALPLWPTTSPHRNVAFAYWIPLLQRILLPGYLGLVAANWSEAYGRFTWMRWPLQVAGVALCVIGYFVLVHQLRSGIRPSSNENAFSPG